MAEEKEASKPAGISDATVKARTGRTWSEWFAILDDVGAVNLAHKAIVALLSEHHRVGPWWRQMITVAYEQERGLREKHQTPEGFQISTSKTITAPVGAVFGAWANEEVRGEWLKAAGFNVRKATEGKSVRIAWGDGTSSVDVSFYARGPEKSRVVVDHKRLAGAGEVARMKAFWSEALEALRRIVER
ncbi:MAG TPA: DUF4287 domain-containing protein [Thermoanaerobaculaceae bacterium]|nr:DUF4287 domain-containing protein [Thermoanaerobaculaceae bacterium]